MRSTEMLSCARLLLCLIVGPLAIESPAEDRAKNSNGPLTYTARVLNPKLTGSFYEPVARRLLIWGTDGTILHSADGVTWSYANTGIDADLTRIAADIRGNVLIAVGERGMMLRSEDSGHHWHAVALSTSCELGKRRDFFPLARRLRRRGTSLYPGGAR